jgi:hypothetical protein
MHRYQDKCTISGFLRDVSEIFALWDVTQRGLVVIDVLGQPIGPFLKGKSVQESGPVGCPETSGTTILRNLTSQKSEDLVIVVVILLALHLFMNFGLLSISLPCFSIHGHLTPIMNLHYS